MSDETKPDTQDEKSGNKQDTALVPTTPDEPLVHVPPSIRDELTHVQRFEVMRWSARVSTGFLLLVAGAVYAFKFQDPGMTSAFFTAGVTLILGKFPTNGGES